MSRLGKQPIILPTGVTCEVNADLVLVKGPKGELTQKLAPMVKLAVDSQSISVSVEEPEDKRQRALWGLFRSLLNNLVQGVTVGFSKTLEINGVGYKVSGSGQQLNFSLGFSHPVIFNLPAGVSASVNGNQVTLSGLDKQLVGEMAAQIRRLRPPEPYKGKGIKYLNEIIRRKAGKTAAGAK